MARTALVLGGGGVTGIAWELGILAGLAQAGIDLTSADSVIGTSAGSVVGAQITGPQPIRELYERQLSPADREIGAVFSRRTWMRFVPPMLLPGSNRTKLARIGRMAMRAHPPGGQERIEVIRSRIDVRAWPDRDLRITAVEAETGELTVFEQDSGVDLVSAIAASCAVPLIWPPVTIDDRHYIDGGMRSTANVDLARGAERLVVLAPLPLSFSRSTSIAAQVRRVAPVSSVVITPDAEARSRIGKNLLDPTKRVDAARTGLRQGTGLVAQLREVWLRD